MKRSRIDWRRVRQIAAKIILLMIAAVALTWLLEYRYYVNNASAVADFVAARTTVFWYSSLIMFFVLLFFYGLFRKVFISIATVAAIILGVGYIHIAKFNFRGMPLLPEDFQLGSQAGTLTKFVDPWDIVRLVIAIILTIALGKLLDKLTAKWLSREKPESGNVWWRRYRVISRIAIIAVALTGFMVTTDFARNRENTRNAEIEFLNSKFTDWNQVWNYNDNGFLIGFLYNLRKLNLEAPAGYSKEKMAEIRLELEEDAKDKSGNAANVDDVNIVMILNESFFDPELVRAYYDYTGGDVTPELHRLQQIVPHGTMFSPDYGGGTANIEFETMTGLTNYFMKTVPYTNLIPKQKTMPSIASFAKEHGYATTAIHPFNGGMYKRNIVLEKMGFERFITETEFDFRDKDGASEYINDKSSYQQLFKVLSESEKPQLVSLITMQNHAPYNENEYGENRFKVTNVENDEERFMIETYLMTMNLSDAYLGELYDSLQKFDEKTIIMFYGDHSAGVFPQVIEAQEKDISDSARQTPYLLMANFDLDYAQNLAKNGTALKSPGSGGAIELPTTSPNCLPNMLFNALNAEKPLVFYLLDTVCREEPILTDAYFGEERPFMSSALSTYELLSYDITAGNQYFLEK